MVTIMTTTLEQVQKEIDTAMDQWIKERGSRIGGVPDMRTIFAAGYSMGYSQATKDANGFLSEAFNSGNGSYIP